MRRTVRIKEVPPGQPGQALPHRGDRGPHLMGLRQPVNAHPKGDSSSPLAMRGAPLRPHAVPVAGRGETRSPTPRRPGLEGAWGRPAAASRWDDSAALPLPPNKSIGRGRLQAAPGKPNGVAREHPGMHSKSDLAPGCGSCE